MLDICKTVTLEILRTVPMGLILGDEEDEVLLPTRYVPKDVSPGEAIEVFLYTDSEDRPIATTEKPLAQADEFACLRVSRLGASQRSLAAVCFPGSQRGSRRASGRARFVR
jgi:predicted RNA-binding protein (virulence factor B family)